MIGVKIYENSVLVSESQYVYDALGRRVRKQVTNSQDSSKSFTRQYVYDGNEILFEFDEGSNLLATYTHSTLRTDDVLSVDVKEAGRTAKMAQSAGSYFYLKDGLGSVVDITNSGGQIIQHHAYSVFGKLLKITDRNGVDVAENPVVKTPFTYTGREYDEETGLYYYRARFYDPGTGRFLQQDPDRGGKLNNPITFNSKYIYAHNNPINLKDPSGKFACGGLCVAAIIAVTQVTLDSAIKGGNFWENFKDSFESPFASGDRGSFWTYFAFNAAMVGLSGTPTGGELAGTLGFTSLNTYVTDQKERKGYHANFLGLEVGQVEDAFDVAQITFAGYDIYNNGQFYYDKSVMEIYVATGWMPPLF